MRRPRELTRCREQLRARRTRPARPGLRRAASPATSSSRSTARRIKSWDARRRDHRATRPGKTLSDRRSGATAIDQQSSLTPVENLKYVDDTSNKTKTAGYLGVSSAVHCYYAAVPVTQIPGHIVSQIGQGVQRSAAIRARSAACGAPSSRARQRDPTGAIGVVGIGRLGGEIADSHELDVAGQGVLPDQPAGHREPAPVLLQPAAAASARRRTRGRCARRGRQARPGEDCGNARWPPRCGAVDTDATGGGRPPRDLRRHRADGCRSCTRSRPY